MKNIFFICMFGLLAFAGCSDNEEEILTGGYIDIDMLPTNQPNDVIEEILFALYCFATAETASYSLFS